MPAADPKPSKKQAGKPLSFRVVAGITYGPLDTRCGPGDIVSSTALGALTSVFLADGAIEPVED